MWAGLPGQEAGNSLVDVMYGDVSPSGKLPYSIAKNAADYGTTIQASTDTFPEGLFIDYRMLNKKNLVPRYEFGFGLSYTTFNYSGLSITGSPASGQESGSTVPGGAASLFETAASVTVNITNSGHVTGSEVVQVYVSFPSSAPETPVRQLRGFEKVMDLKPGESRTVTITLRQKDFSYWDVKAKKWMIPKGNFVVEVGASSRDIRLQGKVVAT